MGDEDERSKELRRLSLSANAEEEEEAKGIKYASMDALSELVWSPRNGLSIRCADFSFTGKGKLLSPNFFDIGQKTNMEIHSSSTTSTEEARSRSVDVVMDKTEDEVNRRSDELNRPLSGNGGSAEDMKPEREEMVETNDDIENEEGETKVASSKRSLDNPRAIGGKSEALLANEEGDKTNTNRVLCVDRLESTDENDFATLAGATSKALVPCESKGECLPEDETDVEKAGPSGANAKGKEKALSDGNFDGNNDDDDDDDDDKSFGSVESCNSTGLLSRGNKRPGFEQQLILGNKRLKTLSQECLGSTSKLKHDSSFMNWISNMTKGIWKGNEEEDDSPTVALATTSDANGQVNATVDQQQLSQCCLKENSECRNTGFQSFFRSIYCQRERSQAALEMDLPNDANAPSLQELPWIPEQCNETIKEDHLSSSGNEIGPVAPEPNISSGKVGFNQTSETLSSEKNKHEEKEPNISLLSRSKPKPNDEQKACVVADEKVTQCLTNRNSGLESLWISRFSSKGSFPQKNGLHERITNEAVKEANDSASDVDKTRDSQKVMTESNVATQNTILPIVSSLRIESSEAIASSFARRLEAMKHIMSSSSLAENAEEEQTDLICFYCGKKGHPLRDCLEVTDTELRDLVQSISARNGREEASSLCIRCLQLSHWAATCPNARPYSSGAEERAMKQALASTSGTKLPLRDSTEVPKTVFDAVQVLRLTRTDVLKWVNTKKSVTGLEGFFLRLKLRKWEEGLGGTGYYVARIDGDTEGQSSRRNSEQSSVSVKVKGMSCLVESQFISNHDFLEEELKAWWRNAGKSVGGNGGDGIPSAMELSRKIQQRKMLGF